MADKKISQLAPVASFTDASVFEVVQAGTNLGASGSDVLAYINVGGQLSASMGAHTGAANPHPQYALTGTFLPNNYVTSSRQATAGSGLTGGGALTSDISFAVDTSVIATRALVQSQLTASANAQTGSYLPANYVTSSRQVIAGTALAGGGALTADVTINAVTGTTSDIQTVGSTNLSGSTLRLALANHVHAHGSQTDATMHAVATTGSNGFVSSSMVAEHTWLVGEKSKSISAGGTITLATGEHEAAVLRLTGAPTTDTTVDFPSTNGRTWAVRNETTATGSLVGLRAVSGSDVIYVYPSGTRRVTVMNGELRSDDFRVVDTSWGITISGSVTGTYNFSFKFPAAFALRRPSVQGVTTTATAGSVTLALGSSAGGTQVLMGVPSGTFTPPNAGALVGSSSFNWGSELSTNGEAYYGSAPTLVLQMVVSGATPTSGAIRVHFEGRVMS